MATALCKRLRLSINLEDSTGGEEVRIKLANDLTLEEVEICYPVSNNTANRRYHRSEAMVIAMRQVVSRATKEGLISVSRGVSLDLSAIEV